MDRLIFLGPLFPRERENDIRNVMKSKTSSAPNVFQWNLLDGLEYWLGNKLEIVNVLPIGTWPNENLPFYIKGGKWKSNDINGYELGCINIPFFKQIMRCVKTYSYLIKRIDSETEIIVYSAYLPFLLATCFLPNTVKVTAIITDLPEYYDLQNVSKTRNLLRKIQNFILYKCFKNVDRYVVLTKYMYKRICVEKQPWICIEGICEKTLKDINFSSAKPRVIFYSGTLNYRYGIRNLLQSFICIERDDVELWICGSGEAYKEIQDLSKIDSRIKFFGFCTQSQVEELRNKSDVLVNPRMNNEEYTKYSFPSKTMEYMASGKPVVMYKLDGIPDEYDEFLFYVDEGYDSILCLKNKILEVLDNYEDALKKSFLAMKFVQENKNGIVQAKKIIDFIDAN